MPYDDYEIDDFGEFGADPVGQGQTEMGAAVGQGQDEYGAQSWRLMNLSSALRRGASRGRISRRHLSQLSRLARSQARRCAPKGNFPWGGAGFGPPVGPGTGSYGMPLGLGTAAAGAAGGAINLANANNRGVPLRVKRCIIVGSVDVAAGAGVVVGQTTAAYTITAINIGDFPLLTGGAVPGFCFAPDNYSPISYNQLLYPGTNFTVVGNNGLGNSPVANFTGACEVSQL